MLRIIFRTVLVLTLTLLAIIRGSGARLSHANGVALSYWFLFSGLLAIAFLIFSAVKAIKEPERRKLYIRDAMLAIIWVIFWVLNLGH